MVLKDYNPKQLTLLTKFLFFGLRMYNKCAKRGTLFKTLKQGPAAQLMRLLINGKYNCVCSRSCAGVAFYLRSQINRCFDQFLILAKRGTLFKTLKQGPATPINEIVD